MPKLLSVIFLQETGTNVGTSVHVSKRMNLMDFDLAPPACQTLVSMRVHVV